MCDLTVVGLTNRRCAISAFESPRAINSRTSASRGVSPSGSSAPSGVALPARAARAAAARAARAVRARGEGRYYVVLHGRVKGGFTGGDGEDRCPDVLGAGVLGQVAARARAKGAEHTLVVGEGGEGDDPRPGHALAQSPRGRDAVHARHPQVHEHHIWLMGERHGDGLLPVGCAPDELYAAEQREQRRQAFAHEPLVVGEQDPYRSRGGDRRRHAGSTSWTRKPSCVGSATSVPPRSSARSRIPVRP